MLPQCNNSLLWRTLTSNIAIALRLGHFVTGAVTVCTGPLQPAHNTLFILSKLVRNHDLVSKLHPGII